MTLVFYPNSLCSTCKSYQYLRGEIGRGCALGNPRFPQVLADGEDCPKYEKKVGVKKR